MPGMEWANSRDWRACEMLSANVQASARGLSKLGSYMAQGGTADGRTIMSEEGWEEFHEGRDSRIDWAFPPFESDFT